MAKMRTLKNDDGQPVVVQNPPEAKPVLTPPPGINPKLWAEMQQSATREYDQAHRSAIREEGSSASVKDPRGRPRFHRRESIAAALKAARGNFTRAAHLLTQACGFPVYRQTIASYVERDPTLAQLQQQITETKIDLIEDLVWQSARLGDPQMQRYVLSRQGSHRGWGSKTEVTGKGGGKIGLDVDLSAMKNDDLELLQKLIGSSMVGVGG